MAVTGSFRKTLYLNVNSGFTFRSKDVNFPVLIFFCLLFVSLSLFLHDMLRWLSAVQPAEIQQPAPQLYYLCVEEK